MQFCYRVRTGLRAGQTFAEKCSSHLSVAQEAMAQCLEGDKDYCNLAYKKTKRATFNCWVASLWFFH